MNQTVLTVLSPQGMVMNAVFQLIGSLIISFFFNWKLALVAFFVTIPLGIFCAFFRFRYEIGFEKMSAAVSTWSSHTSSSDTVSRHPD